MSSYGMSRLGKKLCSQLAWRTDTHAADRFGVRPSIESIEPFVAKRRPSHEEKAREDRLTSANRTHQGASRGGLVCPFRITISSIRCCIRRIVAIDRVRPRLELALELGATDVVDA